MVFFWYSACTALHSDLKSYQHTVCEAVYNTRQRECSQPHKRVTNTAVRQCYSSPHGNHCLTTGSFSLVKSPMVR